MREGWVADKAIAIAVYCTMLYKCDFMKAVLLMVNHKGDSDIMGAITGNILGVLRYTRDTEGVGGSGGAVGETGELAAYLYVRNRDDAVWRGKYPGR